MQEILQNPNLHLHKLDAVYEDSEIDQCEFLV